MVMAWTKVVAVEMVKNGQILSIFYIQSHWYLLMHSLVGKIRKKEESGHALEFSAFFKKEDILQSLSYPAFMQQHQQNNLGTRLHPKFLNLNKILKSEC